MLPVREVLGARTDTWVLCTVCASRTREGRAALSGVRGVRYGAGELCIVRLSRGEAGERILRCSECRLLLQDALHVEACISDSDMLRLIVDAAHHLPASTASRLLATLRRGRSRSLGWLPMAVELDDLMEEL